MMDITNVSDTFHARFHALLKVRLALGQHALDKLIQQALDKLDLAEHMDRDELLIAMFVARHIRVLERVRGEKLIVEFAGDDYVWNEKFWRKLPVE